jgi:uncharacterized protein
MSAATLLPGLPPSYYAPEFVFEVEGRALDPAQKGDVLEVKVVLSVDELASVDVRLNNYDDSTFDLKWSDSDLFRLGKVVHVRLGYADRLTSMFRGRITSLSPEFPSGGPPTLTVRAMDPLVKLKNSRPPADGVTYEHKRDWEIAQAVADRHDVRLEADREGPQHDFVVQRNIDDLAFLTERAARIDFKVFMRIDPDNGRDVLHFKRPRDGRQAGPLRTYQLAWGTLQTTSTPPSLIEFKPTISASDQVQSVTVRGWDVERKLEIEHTAVAETTPGVSGSGDDTGPAAAEQVGGSAGKKEVVVNAPVATAEEARHLAESLLAERAYAFLTGSGKTIGLPDLRPGDNVEIRGVGERFSGTYFVTRTTHVLNTNGYTTEFDVRKTYQGSRA